MKFQKGIFVTIVFLIILILSMYLIVINTASFKISKEYVFKNKTIISNIGEIKKISLDFFGYSINFMGAKGIAEYNIYVKGEKDSGKVFIKMEKDTGVWKIKKANLILKENKIISLKTEDEI